MKIFLLDSDPVSNLIFRRQLQRDYPDVNLTIYVDSEDFLSRMETISKEADFLLIDINHPKHPVTEILDQVKTYDLNANIILISSYVDPCVEAMAAEYEEVQQLIEKPLMLSRMKSLLKVNPN
jgi:response regulator RpfG family c-di-GMP phosphodiesterase